jgi:hypothetical protein
MSRSPAGCPVRPAVELLEDRATPATISWINPAGGAWDDPGNWDLGRTPQPDDDVVIPGLNYAAVIEHASGSDVVQSITSTGSYATLAVTNQSSLSVTGQIHVPTLTAATGGVVTANNTGSLDIDLLATGGGEIHLPAVTDYHGTVFTRLQATGPGSLIDLPALDSLMATTGKDSPPGEVRLDLYADNGAIINLPSLTDVRGHPPDYFIGFTALSARSGGTFVLDTGGTTTFAAAASLIVDDASDLQAGNLVFDEAGDALNVAGSLEAASVFVRQSSIVVSGTLTLGGSLDSEGGAVYGSGTINGDVTNAGDLNVLGTLTINGNYTQTAAGTLSVTLRGAADFDRLVVSGLATLDGTLNVYFLNGYQPQPGDEAQVVQFGAGSGTFARVGSRVPLFGVLYIYQPRDGYQPGVTLLF